jgi:D-arabinose 1-dehydrogenase-like Zn-dependent alcohol dehydrogenase
MENPHMKAARLEEGTLKIRDVRMPISGHEEALIRISSVGVCHAALGG